MNFEEYKKKVGLNVKQQFVGSKFRSSIYGRTRVCTEVTKKTHVVMHTTRTRATLQNEADNINNNPGIESFHAVVGKDGVIETVPVKYVAHHAGRPYWNRKAIGIELVELEIDSGIDNYMKYIGYLCYQEDIVPSAQTLLWHTECGPNTKCAIRLKQDYGKDYLVKGIKKYYNIAKGGSTEKAPKPQAKPKPSKPKNKKVTEKVVNDVILGKYGNGAERKKNLEKAGYNYKEVQDAVNRSYGAKPKTKPKPQAKPKPKPSKQKNNKVTVKKSAKRFDTGERMDNWVKGSTFDVLQKGKGRTLIANKGVAIGWVKDSDLVGGASKTKPKPKRKASSIKKGDTVVSNAKKDIFGTSLDSHMFDGKKKYKVIQVGRNGNKDQILLDGVMTWVHKSKVKKV